MAKAKKKAEPVQQDDYEAQTQQVGEWLFSHLHRRQPSIFDRRWWDDRILNWAMADEAV